MVLRKPLVNTGFGTEPYFQLQSPVACKPHRRAVLVGEAGIDRKAVVFHAPGSIAGAHRLPRSPQGGLQLGGVVAEGLAGQATRLPCCTAGAQSGELQAPKTNSGAGRAVQRCAGGQKRNSGVLVAGCWGDWASAECMLRLMSWAGHVAAMQMATSTTRRLHDLAKA